MGVGAVSDVTASGAVANAQGSREMPVTKDGAGADAGADGSGVNDAVAGFAMSMMLYIFGEMKKNMNKAEQTVKEEFQKTEEE